MRRILVSESLSLDGVFEAPAKLPGEPYPLAGWAEGYQSQEQNEYLAKGLGSGGALLLGRVTYEHMRQGWEHATGPVADFMNNAPKFVASRTLRQADWQNTTLLAGDAVEAVRALRAQPGKDLAILGSGQLANALRAAGLIDEYSLLVFPLVLGQGQRFFTGEARTGLKLKEAKPFSSGVVLLTYVPEGK